MDAHSYHLDSKTVMDGECAIAIASPIASFLPLWRENYQDNKMIMMATSKCGFELKFGT